MNRNYSLFVFLFIAGLSMAEDNGLADYMKKYDELAKVVCGSDKAKITDEQVTEIVDKCVCKDKNNNTKTGDDLIKTCFKVDEPTERQKVTALCDQKDCMVKAIAEHLSKESAESITKKSVKMDTYLKCVKSIIKPGQ